MLATSGKTLNLIAAHFPNDSANFRLIVPEIISQPFLKRPYGNGQEHGAHFNFTHAVHNTEGPGSWLSFIRYVTTHSALFNRWLLWHSAYSGPEMKSALWAFAEGSLVCRS